MSNAATKTVNTATQAVNSGLIVHQAYKVGQSFDGQSTWRIAFLCPARGIVEIFRSIQNSACEFEQAALVRSAIAQFRTEGGLR